MDLNKEAGVLVDLNLFEVMSDDAPGSEHGIRPEDIARRVREIVLAQGHRAKQRHNIKTELLHHPLPPVLSTRRALELIDAYFQVGRGVMWRYNLEPLATTRRSETRGSLDWMGAVSVYRQMTRQTQDFVRRSISDVQLALNWERHRVAYSVDPVLHQALMATDPAGTPVPAEVLRRIPHPDPVFLLPRGIPVQLADGSAGYMRAFFLRGLIAGSYSASTSDEEVTHFQVCALTSMDDVNGVPTDWDLSGVSIPLDQPFTVDSASHHSAARWDAHQNETGGIEQIKAWTRQILEICLPVVMYCCSVNADAQPAATPAKQRPRKGSKRQAVKEAPAARVLNLGYRVGPALTRTASRRERAQTDAHRTGVGTGRKRRTHIRRAHWHTYWYGPRDGAREARLKWVAMRVINEGGEPEITTVVPVR